MRFWRVEEAWEARFDAASVMLEAAEDEPVDIVVVGGMGD